MKTIEEREWLDYKGEPKLNQKEENAKISDVLLMIANSYVPSNELILIPADMRMFNKAVGVLELSPSEGKFWFEDDHFLILKGVIVSLAPRMSLFARSSGEIEDLFIEKD